MRYGAMKFLQTSSSRIPFFCSTEERVFNNQNRRLVRWGEGLTGSLIGAAFLLSAAGAVRAEAVIEGQVELPKTRSAPVVVQRYEIVSKGGVLAPNPPVAVVYLEGTFPRPGVQPVAQILQKDLLFVPALLPVQVGTKVEFPNLDDCYHNIFSYSPTKRFDLGRYRSDEKPIPSQVFDSAGLVTLRCDIHEHMRGLILVLQTPYFVTTTH